MKISHKNIQPNTAALKRPKRVKLSYLLFGAVMLFTTLINILPQTTPKASADLWGDAYNYSVFKVMIACVESAGNTISDVPDSAASVNTMLKSRTGVSFRSGYVLSGTGFWKCDDIATKFMEAAGLNSANNTDSVVFLDGMGYTYDQVNSVRKAPTKIDIQTINRFAQAHGIQTTQTAELQYQLYFDGLIKACGAQRQKLLSEYGNDQAALDAINKHTNNLYKINVLTGGALAEETVYSVPNPDNAVYANPYLNGSGSVNASIKCSDIVNEINKLAPNVVKTATTAGQNAQADAAVDKICTNKTVYPAGGIDQYDVCVQAVKECLQQGSTVVDPNQAAAQLTPQEALAVCVSGKYNGISLADLTKNVNSSWDAIQQAAADATAAAAPKVDTPQSTPDPCTVLPPDTTLRWLACSLLTTVSGIFDAFYGIVRDLLETDVSKVFSSNFVAATGVFRNIGMTLIVIAGLVMIIAQATGSDIVDAYTVKKVLPKLGIALVGMAFALPLLKFALTLTNDLGRVITSIMGGIVNITGNGGAAATPIESIVGGGAGIFTLILGGGGAYAVFGFWGALSLVGSALLAIIVALITLAIRQLIIVVLVLLAPLAIASYVLPSTEKLWKFWKITFPTTLMTYPIIVLFIESGKLMGSIFASFEGLGYTILAIVATYAPYFMIPMAFKMAGGLIGNISGMVNDRSKGAFDRMRNFRAAKTKQNTQDFLQGNRFKGNSRLGAGMNAAGRAIDVAKSGELGFNASRWGERLRGANSRHNLQQAREGLEKNQYVDAIKANDDYLTAAVEFDGDEDGMRRHLSSIQRGGRRAYDDATVNEAVSQIRMAKRSMGNESFLTAAVMALPATGTAFRGGAGEMHEFINRVAGDDRGRASTMLAAMRQGAMQARRVDLGGGSYGNQLSMLNAQYNGGQSGGMTAADASRRVLEESLEGQGGGMIAGARNNAVQNFAPVIYDRLNDLYQAGGDQSPDFQRELAALAGRYDAMSSVSPENARVLAEHVMSRGFGGSSVSIQQMIEASRSNVDFQSMRREYQSASIAQANAMNQQPNPPTGGSGGVGGTP